MTRAVTEPGALQVIFSAVAEGFVLAGLACNVAALVTLRIDRRRLPAIDDASARLSATLEDIGALASASIRDFSDRARQVESLTAKVAELQDLASITEPQARALTNRIGLGVRLTILFGVVGIVALIVGIVQLARM